ncbi:MAG: hypothetical protein V3U35_00495, partial [Candidatus Neomarinimicrobiota bacterium]
MIGEGPAKVLQEPKIPKTEARGEIDGNTFAVTSSTDRLHLQFVDLLEGQGGSPIEVTTFYKESLMKFSDLVKPWLTLEKIGPIKRLAAGAISYLPVESQDEGYGRLAEYLPGVQIDAGDSHDFLYQINRRRGSTSGITGLYVNRLSRWSLIKIKLVKIRFMDTGEVVSDDDSPLEYACRLELDMNTSSDFEGQ